MTSEIFDPFAIKENKKEDKYVKILVLGKAKVGKTWSVISSFKNIAFIDPENGARLYKDEWAERGNPFEPKVERNLKAILGHVKFLNKNEHKYDALVFDSLTVIYQELLEEVGKQFPLPKNSMQFWPEVKKRWNRFMRECMELKMNVIFIAHEKTNYKSGSDGEMPKIDSENPFTYEAGKGTDHAVDTVLRFFMDGPDRKVQVLGGSRHHKFKNNKTEPLTETYFIDKLGEEIIGLHAKTAEMITIEQLTFINECFRILELSDESIIKLLEDSFDEEVVSELTKKQADELMTKLKNSKKLKAATRKKNSEKEGK